MGYHTQGRHIRLKLIITVIRMLVVARQGKQTAFKNHLILSGRILTKMKMLKLIRLHGKKGSTNDLFAGVNFEKDSHDLITLKTAIKKFFLFDPISNHKI